MTDIKTTELGHAFNPDELKIMCKAIFGAVSFPSKHPGFAVIAGIQRKFGGYDIFLLDEVEHFDMRKLVRQCSVLNYKYLPERWIGDDKNNAANELIWELPEGKRFDLCATPIFEMQNLYSYILPQIRELLTHDHLFLKNSKCINYLRDIREEEMFELKLGDYPSIEALAFAVLELRTFIEIENRTASISDRSPYSNNVLTRGLKFFE